MVAICILFSSTELNFISVCCLHLLWFAVVCLARPPTILPDTSGSPGEPNTVALDTVFVTPTMLRNPRDMSDFFSYLVEMRDKKALSVIGRDKNFIYLLVEDNEARENGVVEGSRRKRSLFKKLSKGLDMLGPTGTRHLAVTIALFNYLGYLPMRVPGVPYHIDTGSPDYNPYNIYNEFPVNDYAYRK